MSRYIDRGIIKWAPFDGLSSFHDMFTELKYRLGKTEQPVLMDDKMTEIDRNINTAFRENKEVFFSYYEDGYIKSGAGMIRKTDDINHLIHISGGIYRLDSLVSLQINDETLD